MCLCRCPWLTKVISPAVPLYNGLVFLFVLANFSLATFMDPGVYPRGWSTVSTFPPRSQSSSVNSSVALLLTAALLVGMVLQQESTAKVLTVWEM